MKRNRWLWAGALSVIALGVGVTLYNWSRSNSLPYIYDWFQRPQTRATLTTALSAPCEGAPFLLPSSGLVGLLYADPAAPYNVFRRHSGIDIFGDGAPGEVPIVAAYDGWLTRLPDWKSTVIIRHDDPLVSGRTIWTYYTHMANVSGEVSFIAPEFPPATYEKPVQQGQLLGYQGDYGGNMRVGLHLHFSIVLSDDSGSFRNEAQLINTLDPSPYLGMALDARQRPPRPSRCLG